ncbi:MAG: DUF2191 domain-containing protein [Candidatus Hydrogenedentes bacterium]|nr:DUF2191 domain-containing protein [Candidatus Hydrogenedentota bacterium]
MLQCMRTTININDDLLRKAKLRAAKSNRTLTSMIEDGLRRVLHDARTPAERDANFPTSGSGGVQPGVDLDDTSALIDRMNGTR